MQAPSKRTSKMDLQEGWAAVACPPHQDTLSILLWYFLWGDSKAFFSVDLFNFSWTQKLLERWEKHIWIKFQDLIRRQETSRQAPRSFLLSARALLFCSHCTETAIPVARPGCCRPAARPGRCRPTQLLPLHYCGRYIQEAATQPRHSHEAGLGHLWPAGPMGSGRPTCSCHMAWGSPILARQPGEARRSPKSGSLCSPPTSFIYLKPISVTSNAYHVHNLESWHNFSCWARQGRRNPNTFSLWAFI